MRSVANSPLVFLLLLAATALAPARAGALPPGASGADALARYASGRLLELQGKDAEALAEYERALALDPEAAGVERRLSEVTARLGQTERSLGYAERALARDSTDARALWLKGTALFNLERGPEALRALEAAVRADSEEVEYARTLARVCEQLDRLPEAAAAWRRVVDLEDDDGEGWFQLAALEARLGHFGAADSALAEARAINPLRPGMLFLHGWIEESRGHADSAIELYKHHLRVHADDQVTRRRLVNLLVDQHRFAEARDEAEKVTQARPQDPEALEVQADLALKVKRTREGLQLLERLRALEPGDPALVARVAAVLARNQRAGEAVAAAERWAKAHPGDYRGLVLKAQALGAAGRADSAIAAARAAMAMAPDSLGPRLLLGRYFQAHKRWSEAADVWQQARARFPENTQLALNLAFCREQSGDLPGAEAAARDALAHDPDDAEALNFLGYLFADHNRNLVEAEDLVRRALQKEPDNGAFVDSMGWVYYRLGRLQDARVRLERAVQLTGDDPTVHEHLGDVYKDLRLNELARDQYRLSLQADSSNARVKAKLEAIR